VHSVVPLGKSPTVGEYVSPEATRRRLAEAGIRIPQRPTHERDVRVGAKYPEMTRR
jgi:hypothetical protein